MLSVIFYLCCAGLGLSLSLLAPVFVALLGGDDAIAGRLVLYTVLGTFLFASPVLAIMGRTRRIPQIGSISLVLLVWTILPLLAAVPIIDITDIGYVDGLFEAVSGLTTTGATTLATVETWPQAMLFWRVQLQWMGGFLALLTVLTVLAPIGIGGLSISVLDAKTAGHRMAGWQRIQALMRNFGLYYLALTAFAFLALMFTGVRSFHAATLAMSGVSTGGFLPFDETLDSILSPIGLVIFAILLLIGATSVFWHRMVLTGQTGKLTRHRESYFVIAAALFIGFVLAITLIRVTGDSAHQGTALAEGILAGASLVATSGVESRPGVISLLPLTVVLFIVLVGGSAFSTSGGLKFYRIGGMAVQSWSELDRLIYPHAVRPSRFGTQQYDLQLMKAIWSFFIAAIFTIAFGTIVVATADIPFEAALTATISAFATAGPVYNSGWNPPGAAGWPTFGEFTASGKMALMAVMILGRLEVLALLGLFSAHYWRSR